MDTATERNYDAVIARVSADGSREDRMQRVVDALWDELSPKGVSWVGFYLKSPVADELILGPRRDKPACSPIGMHGACGRSFLSKRSLIVRDVSNLRAGYIACDPRDRSECVIPCMDGFLPWGVLDVDSFDLYAFTRDDANGLQRVLEHAGLSTTNYEPLDIV